MPLKQSSSELLLISTSIHVHLSPSISFHSPLLLPTLILLRYSTFICAQPHLFFTSSCFAQIPSLYLPLLFSLLYLLTFFLYFLFNHFSLFNTFDLPCIVLYLQFYSFISCKFYLFFSFFTFSTIPYFNNIFFILHIIKCSLNSKLLSFPRHFFPQSLPHFISTTFPDSFTHSKILSYSFSQKITSLILNFPITPYS